MRRAARASSGSISIITDHHEPDTELPQALRGRQPQAARLQLRRQASGRRRRRAQARAGALQRAGKTGWLPAFVKIAAIGTLADVVPLVGENRVIAKLGLQLLSKGPHKVGLRALLDVAGLTGKQIDSYHIAFMLAPRVNAAGRMSTPDIATRLLLAADEGMADEARGLAEQLETENTRRRQEEQDIVAKARKVIETDPGRRRRDRCSSSPAKAGTAASSASSRRRSSMRSIARRSCCRSRTASRTGRAAAFRDSTCWRRSNPARR